MVLTTLQHLGTVSSTCTLSCIFFGVFLHCPLPRGPARFCLAHGTHHASALRYCTIIASSWMPYLVYFLGYFSIAHCHGDLLGSAWHMVLTTLQHLGTVPQLVPVPYLIYSWGYFLYTEWFPIYRTYWLATGIKYGRTRGVQGSV